jgi:toxin HigB-1
LRPLQKQNFALDDNDASHYYCMMIVSFKSKEAESIWNGIPSKRIPSYLQDTIRRKLRMINNSISINDLRIPPSNHLEQLKGDRKGQYSIRINDQFRICFEWIDGNSHNIDIVDYH